MTGFATSNRTQLFRVKETTWGTTPASPALVATRYTGEALDNNISTTTSKEINADRMISDLINTDASPTGTINFEMSYGTYDDLFIAGLMTTDWSTALAIVGAAADISTVATATDNLTSTTSGKFTSVVVGQWIKLSGFTGTNNGFFHVTGKTDNQTLTIKPQPLAQTPLLAAAHIDGQYARNGVTEQSFTMVKIFNDSTVVTRHNFTGMRVKQFTLAMKTGSILTGQFTMTGRGGQWTTAAFGSETQGTPSTTSVMSCVSNISNILQNEAAPGATGAMMSMDLTYDNQHREQKGLGILGNVGVVAGQLKIQVKASQYFESDTQALLFENSTAFSTSWQLTDDAGNVYIFTLPRCKYDSFQVQSGQLDSDVMAQTSFTGLKDSVTGCAFQIDKFAGP